MSKIIRKARSQLHSVKDEGIKRQFQAARNDLKHKRRTNTSRNASAGPGFKFSDIDNNDMDDFDWMESSDSTPGTGTNASPQGSGLLDGDHSDRDSFHTSDYHSSHSADESTHSRDPSYDDEEIDITSSSDHGYESHKASSHEANLKTSTRIIDTPKFRSSSLFDDGPDLDDDYFCGGGSTHDPLGASPSSEMTKSLFDTHVIPEGTLDDIFVASSKTKDLKSSTNDNLTNPVDSLFIDEYVEDTVEASADKVLTDSEVIHDSQECSMPYVLTSTHQSSNTIATSNINTDGFIEDEASISSPTIPVLSHDHTSHDHTSHDCPEANVPEQDNENKSESEKQLQENDDEELFMSATNKLITSHDKSSDNKPQDDTIITAGLKLSDVSHDPLSMLANDEERSADYQLDNVSENKKESLLPINENYYTNNRSADSSSHDSTASVQSSKKQSPSTLTQSLPTLAKTPPTHATPPVLEASPRTQMRLNSSGKRVPIIPPRPNASKRQVSAPDLDTMSINSNISSMSINSNVSAYSADEVFLKRRTVDNNESFSSFRSDSTFKSNQSSYQPMEPIFEPPVTSGCGLDDQAPPPSTDSGYKLVTLLLVWLCLYLYYSLNPFVYLAGFLAGFLVFYVTMGTAFYWYVQHSEKEKERRKQASKRVELPALEDLPQSIDVDFESSRVLESKKFGMVYQYYPATHHPSQRVSATVRLYSDYMLQIKYWSTVHNTDGLTNKEVVIVKDLRKCSVLIVPEEVAQNRKRRWSKKFPLSISWEREEGEANSQAFLFTYTSREKEDWFRRMRSANEGKSFDNLVKDQKIFFRYMGKYMPNVSSPKPEVKPISRPQKRVEHKVGGVKSDTHKVGGHRSKGGHKHSSKLASEPVRFSMTQEVSDDEDDKLVSISTDTKPAAVTEQSNGERRRAGSTVTPGTTPTPSSMTYGWINAGLARLAWDLWHEERWLKWVQSRIQRKLIRIKTPSFMEPLKVTAIDMGMDMPVIKRPFKTPKLDSRGIWVYMEVDYKGTFNMTIETKLKLEPKFLSSGVMHFNRGSESPPLSHSPSPSSLPSEGMGSSKPHPHYRSRMGRIRVNTGGDPGEEELSSGSDDEESAASHFTKSLEERLPMELEQQGIPVYSQDDSSISTASNSSSVTSSNEMDSTSGPKGRKEKILTNMVSRLQKIATKSKIVAKAAEKVSSYPLILSVEVKSLNGFLVLNMAPPPSDALWFAFTVNPVLDLVAKPKLGHREVTLSYVTDWIEKKLCDVLEKKLVMPNMEDLVIPVLNSGLPEDKISDLMTPPS